MKISVFVVITLGCEGCNRYTSIFTLLWGSIKTV